MLNIDLEMNVSEPDEVSMGVDDGDEVNIGVGETSVIRDHAILLNRDKNDQHPISAITGLAEALAASGKIDTVKRNGVTLPVVDKAVNIEVPVKTSDLTNDSGYITANDVPKEVYLVQVTLTHEQYLQLGETGEVTNAVSEKSAEEIALAVSQGKDPICRFGYWDDNDGGIAIETQLYNIVGEYNLVEHTVDISAQFYASLNGASMLGYGCDIWVMGTNAHIKMRREAFLEATNSAIIEALGYTPYEKPASGIPKSDLASGVQASLNKADTAIQAINYDLGSPEFDIDGYFYITQQQAAEITALWDNGLCSVTITKEGVEYLAFKDDTQTLNGNLFKIFVGAYYDVARGFEHLKTGTVIIAISTTLNVGTVIPIWEYSGDEGDDHITYLVNNLIATALQDYTNNTANFPKVYIYNSNGVWKSAKRTNDLITYMQSGRSVLGYRQLTADSYDYFICTSYAPTETQYEYTFVWTSVKDGGTDVITMTGNSNTNDYPVGGIWTYNQNRAITDLEIDAICV